MTLWDLTGKWREDGECEVKRREALKETEHQEGQSKSVPLSFQSKSHVLLFVIAAKGIVQPFFSSRKPNGQPRKI